MLDLRATIPALALAALWVSPISAREVGIELVLAIDCSLSVSDPEYRLQMHGIAAALRHEPVTRLILQQPGGVALTVMQWSGTPTIHQAVPWQLLGSESDVERFATAVATAPRSPLTYHTAIGHAIAAAARLILSNDFEGQEENRHLRRWPQQFWPRAQHSSPYRHSPGHDDQRPRHTHR